MIESDGHRPEKSVKVDQAMAIGRVVKIRAATLFQIENDLEPVEQNVLAEHVQNARGGDRFPILALTQTRPRSAGRLGEHGRHTHPLRLAVGADLVNRTRVASYYLAPQREFFSAVALASAALYSATSAL